QPKAAGGREPTGARRRALAAASAANCRATRSGGMSIVDPRPNVWRWRRQLERSSALIRDRSWLGQPAASRGHQDGGGAPASAGCARGAGRGGAIGERPGGRVTTSGGAAGARARNAGAAGGERA